MNDPFDLSRFVDAQQEVYAAALAELEKGHKRTHWMWFIFPQLAGLGRSAMAQHYALGSLTEAQAYLAHPILGTRLRACVTVLQDLPATKADRIFGSVDALKLRSSLTLFVTAGGGSLFEAALVRWFDGQPDKATLDYLKQGETIREG